MKQIFLFFFLVIIIVNGQNKSKTFSDHCYLPNGEKCPREYATSKMTYGEFKTNFEKKGRVWSKIVTDDLIDVVFKSFTKIPLFVLIDGDKNYSSDRIQELIKMASEDDVYYFGRNHFGVKADIKKFIEKKTLDKNFLLETLGNPNEIKQSLFGGKSTECFIYLKEGVRIYFNNDLAIGFEEIE
ncbi:Uncharacterised protein [Chryseobacterium nakagawai]|uniref:Uncharacterized protein n=1 Tax=Chryseobacterium nakagawai TaxID=1241982 RepID=A0AAD1DR81_CHRNA|nr:hypothetical protein [Chryseobacterium nakagawai]AZA91190.1 hypothetical protein EG343_11380 [Chryseobacterium nakagawai]VEH22756.1 Uncharacterised protein [Chryseobacterium nakagawai]